MAKCNVVICFDRPPNLKSFIQRRGRARKAFSKYVIMFEDDGSNSSAVSTWLKLEDEMRQMYMDEMRELQELQALENIEESGKRELINESTGAKLTLDDAVQHLYHFCATLPAAPYVDLRPIFSFEDHSPGSELRSISAKVVLPNSIDVSVREASSTSQWKTEKMARRDAAFEAYAALFHAGLINENFLPLGHVDDEVDEAYTAIEKRPSLVEVQDQVNPWLSIAQEWQDPNHIKTATIKIKEGEECISEMLMFLPCSIPIVYDFDLHWDATTTYQATFKSNLIAKNQSVKEAAAQVTALLLHSQFDSRMDIDRCDFTALFVPPNVANLHDWAEERSGTTKALDLCESNARGNNSGLVRDLSEDRRPHIFHDMRYASLEDIRPDGAMDIDQHDAECRDSIHENNLPNPQMDSEWRENKDLANLNDSQVGGSRPENGTSDENEELDQDRTIEEGPTMDKCMGTLPQNHTTNEGMGVDENDKYQGSILLEVTRLPKKVDFLHHTPEQDAKNAKQSTTRILLAKTCVMDKLPFTYSRFAGFIPSILHKVKVAMIVDRLCETILSPLQFRYRDVVATAIAAPSANEGTDYNRLEFRGDSCLKSFASLVLMAGHLNYHEGILSHQKDHIVSNSSLASAAIQRGLAPFILTKAFTGDKGRPLYNGNLLQDQTVKPREMSSKTLADGKLFSE